MFLYNNFIEAKLPQKGYDKEERNLHIKLYMYPWNCMTI